MTQTGETHRQREFSYAAGIRAFGTPHDHPALCQSTKGQIIDTRSISRNDF
jgi:hypothetical protein